MANTPTDNHQYLKPAEGDDNWDAPLNANFDALDADVMLRDTGAVKDDYTPVADGLFLATDTEVLYIGDGTNWVELADFGAIGTQNRTVTTQTADYSVTGSEVVLVDASSAAVTVTLPSPSSGLVIDVIVLNASNTIRVETPGTETIGGLTGLTLPANDAVLITSDGTNFQIRQRAEHDHSGDDIIPNSVSSSWVELSDTGTSPTANGEWRLNGTNVEVRSGGGIRNLSNIGSGGTEGAIPNEADAMVYRTTNNIRAIDRQGTAIDGGTATDATDIQRVVQTAIDTAGDGLCWLSGDYSATTLTTNLDITSDVTIDGTARFTWEEPTDTEPSETTQAFLYCSGSLGSAVLISTDATEGESTIDVADTTPFSEYQLVRTYRDQTIGSTIHETQQVYRVQSVDGTAETITLTEPLDTSYPTTDNASITPFTSAPSPTIRNITIYGVDDTDDSLGIWFDACDGALAENVRVQGIGERGVYVTRSFGVSVERPQGRAQNHPSLGYGVASNGSAHTHIQGGLIEDARHCTAASVSYGWDRETVVSDMIVTTGENHALDAHETRSITFRDCEVTINGDFDNAIVTGAMDTTIDGLTVRGSGGAINTYSIDSRGTQTGRSLRISNLTTEKASGVQLRGDPGTGFDDVSLDNCHIRGGRTIFENSDPTVERVQINNCSIVGGPAGNDVEGVIIDGASQGNVDVMTTDTGGCSISILNSSNIRIEANVQRPNRDNLTGQDHDAAVQLVDSDNCVVSGMSLDDVDANCVNAVAEYGTSDFNVVEDLWVTSGSLSGADTSLSGANSVSR